MRGWRWRPSQGFSLVEVLVALALVSAVVLAMLVPIEGGLRLTGVQPDVADLDQRLRVASSAIRAVLERAGAGLSAGEQPGALTLRWPAVFPHRRGADAADPPDSAFGDRFTVFSAARDGTAPALSLSMHTAASPVGFLTGFPCPSSDARCGFRPGDVAAVDDALGRADVFRVTTAEAGVVAHQPAVLSRAYTTTERSRVIGLEARHFRFDATRRQLRTGAGGATDAPLLDDVRSVEVRYIGTSRPPPVPRPPLGEASCLFDQHGHARLPDLAGAVGGLVELPLAAFADGPFCGEGAGRYDADLLRVRRIAVRVVVGWVSRAGAGGPRTALDHVSAEREVLVDVVPRNLDVAW